VFLDWFGLGRWDAKEGKQPERDIHPILLSHQLGAKLDADGGLVHELEALVRELE
jgi:hypothetical protein